jgi:hypothetical protein
MAIKSYMNVQVASIVFAQPVRRRTWEVRFRLFLTLGPGRTQIFWMYALEGDRVSVDASSVLKDRKVSSEQTNCRLDKFQPKLPVH